MGRLELERHAVSSPSHALSKSSTLTEVPQSSNMRWKPYELPEKPSISSTPSTVRSPTTTRSLCLNWRPPLAEDSFEVSIVLWHHTKDGDILGSSDIAGEDRKFQNEDDAQAYFKKLQEALHG